MKNGAFQHPAKVPAPKEPPKAPALPAEPGIGNEPALTMTPDESISLPDLTRRFGIQPGDIRNRILGLEEELPSKAIEKNDITLGLLGTSLIVLLTADNPVDDGVRIAAVDNSGIEYSHSISDVQKVQPWKTRY